MLTINGNEREPSNLAIDGSPGDFFATEGELRTNGQEHYDLFRRYGISSNSLVLWLDQTAIKAGIAVATWSDLSAKGNDFKQSTAGSQPPLAEKWQKDASRNLDGSADYMHQKVYDDETGASFWPTYPGMIAVDGSAAIRFEGVDISPFAGVAGSSTPYFIDIIDSSGTAHCFGYLAEADGSLALGTDVANGWDFTDGWTTAGGGTTADDKDSFTTYANGGLYKDILTVGKHYKLTVNLSSTTTVNLSIIDPGVAITAIGTGSGTYYFTAVTDYTHFYFNNIAAGTTDVTTFTCEEVTALGADGCHIVSTKGGSTQNWAYKDASFDFNDSSGYTFEVIKTDFQITGNFFASFWVYCDDPTNFPILDKLDATNNKGFRIGVDGNDKPFCSIGDGTDTQTATWASAISASTWYKISAGYDGTNAFINVDVGTRVTQAQSAPADTEQKAQIGTDGTNYADGKIAAGIVIGRAVSTTEDDRIFQGDRKRFGK